MKKYSYKKTGSPIRYGRITTNIRNDSLGSLDFSPKPRIGDSARKNQQKINKFGTLKPKGFHSPGHKKEIFTKNSVDINLTLGGKKASISASKKDYQYK
jgi:hypothetical protein